MPTYLYYCQNCEDNYEATRSIKTYDGQDPCPTCQTVGERRIEGGITVIGAAVEQAEFNPAFGKVVKNKYERAELAKRYGVEEIGNETPDTIYKNIEGEKEKQREKEWAEL